MSVRKMILTAAALVAMAGAAPAFAQMVVGTAIKDTAGGAVGTVTSVDGDFVVVKTDKHEVRLPQSSFAKGDGAYILGMTQADLNASVEQALAQASAAIAVGATVKGPGGEEVGTIQEVDDQFVTVQLAGGETKVRLPKTAVGATQQGPVIGMTKAQLEAQAGGGTAN